MWYLVCISNPDRKHVLLVGKEYVVGRKDCDIQVEGDKAVSRRHSLLTVTHPEANLGHPHRVPELQLKDVSKFGTFVNKERLEDNRTTVNLKDGDEVVFGSPTSSFMAVYEPFVITSSCLDNNSKKTIRSQLLTLGGHMVNEWRKDCSLLVMNSISVTIKVICALISLKPVVKPNYLERYIQYLKGEAREPKIDMYLPELVETQLDPASVTFGKDPKRQTIFQGMKFIFLNPKQFKKMSLAIELAGGTPVLMEEGCDSDDDRVLVEPNTVVMNCNPEDQTQNLSQNGRDWVQHVHTYLKKHKKQVIQDAELGYAVLYCSTEKHCNPDVNKGEQIFGSLPSQTLDAEVLVANTEPSQMGTQRRMRVTSGPQTIDETKLKSPNEETVGSSTDVKIGFFSSKWKKELQSDFTEPDVSSVKRVKKEKVSPKKEVTMDSEDTVKESERKHGSKSYHFDESNTDSKPIHIDEDEQLVRRFGDEDQRVRVQQSQSVKTVVEITSIKNRQKKSPSPSKESLQRETTEIVRPTITTDETASDRSRRSPARVSLISTITSKKSPCRNLPENRVVKKEIMSSEGPGESLQEMETEADKDYSERVGKQVRLIKWESESTEDHQNTEPRIPDTTRHLTIRLNSPTIGFLTSRQPHQGQEQRNSHYLKEEDQPLKCMDVKFTDLLMKRPRPAAVRNDTTPDGFSNWKGKVVRNFKRFRKSEHAGSGQLPRIIGGSDLVVHAGSQRKELDDWFKEAVQAESQQSEEDRRARDLFEWEPGKSKMKRSR